MINNFETILNIIAQKNVTEDNFFFLQIIKRRKENPEMTSNNITCDVLYIKDAEHLAKKEDRIIKRCNDENARAYINLNMRSKRKVALQTMKNIAECIANDNYNVANAYASAAGSTHQDPNKTWVIDIDYDPAKTVVENRDAVRPVTDVICELILQTGKTPNLHLVPTRNGIHIISQPFNTQLFKEVYPDIDIHKDNPTILYVP